VRIASLFLLAAAAAGCSSGSNQSASTGELGEGNSAAASADAAPRACDVLTQEDAARALGRHAEKLASDGGPAGLDICQYGYQGERIADMGNVSVTVQPLDLASVKSGAEAQGFRFEPVSNLGDAAFYSADVGLYVGKGDRTAIYLLAANGMTDPKAKVIALARETIGRL
jgi:hypothetical protein